MNENFTQNSQLAAESTWFLGKFWVNKHTVITATLAKLINVTVQSLCLILITVLHNEHNTKQTIQTVSYIKLRLTLIPLSTDMQEKIIMSVYCMFALIKRNFIQIDKNILK